MKLQKGLAVLTTLSILGLTAACNDGGGGDRYQEGFTDGKKQGYQEGYDVGYDDGYADGDEAGFERAKTYFASADYNSGFADGKVVGTSLGYSQGYGVGKQDGKVEGYNTGYNVGYDDGEEDGYDRGYDDGYDDGYGSNTVAFNAGYSAGYDDGDYDGYTRGYDDGEDDGYELGYDVGWDAGWEVGFGDGYNASFSVGKTQKMKGYANVLSMFHNDLIDYSKIKAPMQTKRGLVADGKLLFSETSVTNKDTLKRAAVVEQYLVVEMAKQVKGKFGLSAERSLKVAKAANHFRKYSSKRALTAEDTNAYAAEIIGADFKAVEKAFDASMKGDLSGLNKIMDAAAAKNGVTPEKMNQIISQLFI